MLRRHTLNGGRKDWFGQEPRPVEASEEQERWKLFIEHEERTRLAYAQFNLECQISVFMRTRPGMAFSGLSLLLCSDKELWAAETAEDWSRLWNTKLGKRLHRDGLHGLSAIGLVQAFSGRYTDISTAPDFGRGRQCGDFDVLLLRIHEYVLSFADNRVTLNHLVTITLKP
jgi:hypothetical protein